MAIEIIDLTDSPPSPPRSNSSSSNNNNVPMILNFGAVSAQYPNMHHIHHQTNYTLWPNASPGVHSTYYHTSHIATTTTTTTRFVQPSSSMLGDQVTTTVLEPVLPESNAFLFPHGTILRDPWTQREHELFLMGLIKFGTGRWTKIARHFLWNKTPQQVQSYAASFFRHLPATYLHGFRRRKTNNNNNNSAVFQASPPYGDAAASSRMTTYGSLQMETVGSASTSRASMISTTTTTASADGGEEIDLELRLG